MVVDTSALVAILFREADAAVFDRALAASPIRLLSAATRVELSFVVEGRKGSAGRVDLERLLFEVPFEIVSFSQAQAEIAIEAFRKFGKGRHPAGLNIGDCYVYALAKTTGQTLLFKGEDFKHTDIVSALTP